MRVRVDQRIVLMPVCVGLRGTARFVLVPVVLVVHVNVLVVEHAVSV